jgi:hypothetical protein
MGEGLENMEYGIEPAHALIDLLFSAVYENMVSMFHGRLAINNEVCKLFK